MSYFSSFLFFIFLRFFTILFNRGRWDKCPILLKCFFLLLNLCFILILNNLYYWYTNLIISYLSLYLSGFKIRYECQWARFFSWNATNCFVNCSAVWCSPMAFVIWMYASIFLKYKNSLVFTLIVILSFLALSGMICILSPFLKHLYTLSYFFCKVNLLRFTSFQLAPVKGFLYILISFVHFVFTFWAFWCII